MDSSHEYLKVFFRVYVDKVLMINDEEIGYKVVSNPYSGNIPYYRIVDVYLALREFDSDEWDKLQKAILECKDILKTSYDELNKTSYTNGFHLINILEKVIPEKKDLIRYTVKEMDLCLNLSPCRC